MVQERYISQYDDGDNLMTVNYESKLKEFVDGKKLVSDRVMYGVVALTFLIALCNALMNAFYGSDQSDEIKRQCLFTLLFFLGDMILIALAYLILDKKRSLFLGKFALSGFVFLSIFSAVSLLIGQQHEKNNLAINMKKAAIESIKQRTDSHDPKSVNYRDASRELQVAVKEMNNMISEKGGYIGSSSAIYYYLSETFPALKVETISLFFRFIWSVVFVSGSLAMGGIINSIYSPSVLIRYKKMLVENQTRLHSVKAIVPDNVNHKCTVPIGTVHSDKNIESHLTNMKEEMQNCRELRTPDKDRYNQIKGLVSNGAVKPSVRSLKEYGISTDISSQYLKNMAKEGVINRVGRGYSLAIDPK